MVGALKKGQLQIEDQVLLVWREMLGSPAIAPEDNFFEAGGTSLAAARLASRLSVQLELSVTAADILAHPSVRSLSRKLAGDEGAIDSKASSERAALQRNAFRTRRPNGSAGGSTGRNPG
jgi:hypothetical protein